MKTFAAYLLGAIMALVMTARCYTCADNGYVSAADVAIVQSLQSSLIADAVAAESSSLSLFLSESGTSAAGALAQRLRTPVRVMSSGSEPFAAGAQSFDHSHATIEGLSLNQSIPHSALRRGVDYYIYTLRKIII